MKQCGLRDCTVGFFEIVVNDELDRFVEHVMAHTKRRKRDVIQLIRGLPGFKAEFILNDSWHVYESHVEVFAAAWAASDLQDGRPPKPLYEVCIPYGSTPSVMLFTHDPREQIEQLFPEAVVRVTMEA
jgi:hypothetical protein